MGKLVGGEYLLDLTPITIAESVDGETFTNITNKNVIKQLTNLKEYIRNPKAIKPVWVKFVNDENDAVIVTRGSLSIVDDGEFDIDVSIKGYTLKIHVEFTQATLEDSTPIDDWYIDTNDAKYLFTSDAQNITPIIEDVVEGGTLDNAKPIFWHGIDMYKSGVNSFQFHILNNSNTPIDTLAKIKAWAESIEGQVNITGNGAIVINNVAYTMTVLTKQANNTYSIVYVKTTGYSVINNITLEDYFTTFSDSTNKIN